MKIYHSSTRPLLLLVFGFLFFIILGGCLLKLPYAYHDAYQGELSWIRALFTATSAVTVTGLSAVDSANFSLFGQTVIMVLIQIGGLGFMTLAIAVMLSIGIRIGNNSQQVAHEALGVIPLNMVGSTAKAVILFALSFEILATLILTLAWQSEKGWLMAAYEALFYSVSAFNNAGFGLTGANLIPYANSIVVNLTITTLIILGGLGFAVLIDIRKNRTWDKFSLNTKLMLSATLIINLMAFLAIFVLERHNPDTLADVGLQQQLLSSWFQAVTPRTAGFNTMDIGKMSDASTLLILFLMFIGGGSLSTAGGIKLGTFVVLILTTLAYIRRKDSVTIRHYSISDEQIRKALALFSISLLLVVGSVFILLLVENKHPFLDVLFEVVSALSTVGLSRGITMSPSPAGEFVLMLMMFIGRLGPLTIAYLIMFPTHTKVRYPTANIHIG